MMRVMRVVAALLVCAGVARGQTAPATRAAPPTLTNAELAVRLPVKELVTLQDGTVGSVVDYLTDLTHANIVVNWRALGDAGVTKQTPVRMSMHNVAVEDVIRGLVEGTETTKSRLNFEVGGGVILITTNAELGKAMLPRLYDVKVQLNMCFDGKPTDESRGENAKTLQEIINEELRRSGELTEGGERKMEIKDDTLAVTQTRRAQIIIQRVLAGITQPVKVNQFPFDAAVTPAMKKADEAMQKWVGGEKPRTRLIEIATKKDWSPAEISYVLLAGSDREAQVEAPLFAYDVMRSGAVLIGPLGSVQYRMMMATYDVREIVKRLAFRAGKNALPLPEYSADIVKALQTKIEPKQWADLKGGMYSMTEYNGLLIVVAPARTQRSIAAALADIYR